MKNRDEILEITEQYVALFPAEAGRVRPFTEYLARTESDQLYTRKNFDGHITTSAFIIDANTKEILLLQHKSLDRWLQPGGHTEGDASLLASALREAVEETGMAPAQLEHIAVAGDSDVPFDIDSHYIPPNLRKEEDGHYHHDLRYLFVYRGIRDNDYNADESTGMQWVSMPSLRADETFGAVIEKINAIKR